MLFLSDITENFGHKDVRVRRYSCNEADFKNIYNCLDFIIQEFQTAVNDQNPDNFRLYLSPDICERLHDPDSYRCIKILEIRINSSRSTIKINYSESFSTSSKERRESYMEHCGRQEKAVTSKPGRLEIREVLVDGPATIIFWDNGTKTVVKRDKQHDKKDNRREALILAILKQTNTSSYKIAKLYSNPNKDKRTLAEYLLRKSYPWNEDYGRKWLNNTVKLIKEQTNAGFSHVRIVFHDNKQPEIFVREVKI